MQLKTILILTCLLSMNAFAEIHKWIDKQGRIHYSDKKPENTATTAIEIRPHINSNPTTSTPSQPDSMSQARTPKKIESTPYKKKHKMVMYAASWCGYCKKARAFFRKNKIRFTEYDIEKDPKAKKRYEKFGGTGVPLIVSGRKKMQGFSESRFENFYRGL